METELTKQIKKCTHFYKPKMSTGEVGRTIRYADEVWTPNGIVDSIRFEDYVSDVHEDCRRINYQSYLANDCLLQHLPPNSPPLGGCKISGNRFPCNDCKGCFYHTREVKEIDMMITAYEVKITLSDFKSKNGHSIDNRDNPIANENFYCVPKELVVKIRELVPEHVGILSYGANGLRKVKDAVWLDVEDRVKIELLYNAMKKWCDGKQK